MRFWHVCGEGQIVITVRTQGAFKSCRVTAPSRQHPHSLNHQQLNILQMLVFFYSLRNYREAALQEKKASAEEIRFAELNKNPEKYYDEFVQYIGEVLQMTGSN